MGLILQPLTHLSVLVEVSGTTPLNKERQAPTLILQPSGKTPSEANAIPAGLNSGTAVLLGVLSEKTLLDGCTI